MENKNLEIAQSIQKTVMDEIKKHDAGATAAEKGSNEKAYHIGQLGKFRRANRDLIDIVHAEGIREEMLRKAAETSETPAEESAPETEKTEE